MTRVITTEATVQVEITIADNAPTDVFSRMWEDADCYESLYGVMTEDEVLDHLTFNCIDNWVEDASRLDGWADLEKGMLTMKISEVIQ